MYFKRKIVLDYRRVESLDVFLFKNDLVLLMKRDIRYRNYKYVNCLIFIVVKSIVLYFRVCGYIICLFVRICGML